MPATRHLVGALLTCLIASCRDHGPAGMITATRALDDGSVVIGWEGRTSGAARLDPEGRVMWTAPLWGRPLDVLPLPDDGISLRTREVWGPSSYTLARTALARGDGRLRWRSALWAYARELPRPFAYAILSGSYVSEIVDEVRGTPGAVDEPLPRSDFVVVDARTGAIVARRPAHDVYAPETLGSRVFLRTGTAADTAVFEHHGSGTVTNFAIDATAMCLIDSAAVSAVRVLSGIEIAFLREGQPAPQTTQVITDDGYPTGCAAYGDKLVLELAIGLQDEAALRTVTADGRPSNPLALGGVIASNPLRDHHRSNTTEGGQLTRFVPYRVVPKSPGAQTSKVDLVLVDLERMELVRRWSGHTLHESVFRIGRRWYITLDQSRVAVLDGDTGKINAVVEWSGGMFPPITPDNFAGDSLWIATTSWRDALEPFPVARLDAATLEPRYVAPPIEVRKVLDDPRVAP